MMTPPKTPPIQREMIAPAPHLMGNNRCSDCNVTAIWAGDHNYKVCPECYGVLWHTDWSSEERSVHRAERLARAAREAEREIARQMRIAERDKNAGG